MPGQAPPLLRCQTTIRRSPCQHCETEHSDSELIVNSGVFERTTLHIARSRLDFGLALSTYWNIGIEIQYSSKDLSPYMCTTTVWISSVVRYAIETRVTAIFGHTVYIPVGCLADLGFTIPGLVYWVCLTHSSIWGYSAKQILLETEGC